MKNNLVVIIIVAVVVAGAAFYGGMMYQKSQASTGGGQFGQNGTRAGQRRFGGGNANGNGTPVVGKIVRQDANSLTIQLQDGSTKIVNVSGSTSISKTDTGTVADLKSGENVAAFGTSNSDGSITAQNIQLNPMFRMGRGGSPRPTQ